jgi:hypothetical protein
LLKWLEVLCAVWLLLFPAPQYASFAGIVGLVVYAFASGLPILLIALFGSFMKQV